MLRSKVTLHKPLGSLCGDEVDVLKQGPFAPMIQGTEAPGFTLWSQGERGYPLFKANTLEGRHPPEETRDCFPDTSLTGASASLPAKSFLRQRCVSMSRIT